MRKRKTNIVGDVVVKTLSRFIWCLLISAIIWIVAWITNPNVDSGVIWLIAFSVGLITFQMPLDNGE